MLVPILAVHELYMQTMAEYLEKVIGGQNNKWKNWKKIGSIMKQSFNPCSQYFLKTKKRIFPFHSIWQYHSVTLLEELYFLEWQRHPYNHQILPQYRPCGLQIIRMSNAEKVLLPIVLADKEKVLYSQRCFHDIDTNDICIVWCKALKSSTYGKQSTWLINTLRSFMTKLAAMISS